ncbi:MAG: V-type ATP synthase subunit F [Clostridia bacterium]|nr:V-type ATP synthase subunit F [Clostridia bacterium]
MAYSIGVIGDRESVLSFKAVGLKVFECETRPDALKALKSAAEDCAVIFVTEKVYETIAEEIRIYDDKPLPAIIPYPGTSGGTGLGMELLNRSVEKAVGSNILQN